VNYSAVVPVLVEAIKEQQKQLETKDGRIADLERSLAEMRTQVAALQREQSAQSVLQASWEARLKAMERQFAAHPEKGAQDVAAR